jgi:signal transduction histidine kinase
VGSIRGSLTWRVGALIAAALVLYAIAYHTLVLTPFVERQTETNLSAAGAQARARIKPLFDQVAQDLELARQRGRAGLLGIEDPNALNSWFIPYLSHTAEVSSVLYAREDGREILLLKQPGLWMNRLTDRAAHPGEIRRIRRDEAGAVVSEAYEKSDYDPRRRPWFVGAMALENDALVFWTEPYLFFTTKEPGITAATRWTGADGRRYVLALDVLLRDLARITRTIEVSPRGFAALLTGDGKVLAPPRVGGIGEARLAASMMAPVEQIGAPPLLAAFKAWHDAGAKSTAVFPIGIDGVVWIARFEVLPLSATGICIVTMAPTEDFAPLERHLFAALAFTSLIVLGLGLWFAWQLARRFSAPLERLAADSERIGNLDFAGSAGPHASGWREIERLHSAQNRMRGMLREATGGLEEANRELEHRVRERTAELQGMVRELEAFSYSVSHDLRSPLGVISGFAHLLAEDEASRLSEEGRRKLAVIESSVERLVAIVDALLALAHVNRAALQRKPVDMRAISLAVAAELRPNYPRARIDVGALPAAGGDGTLLTQMLSNLVDNALKYASRVEAPLVEIGWREGAYFVRDNGIGFDERYAERLFRAFERLQADGEFPGTGIGLAIVKRIVDRHGGRVWAQGAPGRGATFFFTLGADF